MAQENNGRGDRYMISKQDSINTMTGDNQYGLDFLKRSETGAQQIQEGERMSMKMQSQTSNSEQQMKRRQTVKNVNSNPNAISGVPIVKPDGSVTLLQAAQLEIVKEILTKPPEARNSDELRQLLPLFRNIKFFKEQNIQDADLPEIVQCLKFESLPKEKVVFEYGTVGEKFFMILDGEVSVIIPNPECKDFGRRYQEMQDERKWNKEIKDTQKSIEIAEKRLEQVTKQLGTITATTNATAANNRSQTKNSQELKKSRRVFMNPSFQMNVEELQLLEDQDGPDGKKEFNLQNLHKFDDSDIKLMTPQELFDQESERLNDLMKIHLVLKEQIFFIRKNDKAVPLFKEFCKLEPGKAFGEQALLKNNEAALRAATIKCSKDCHFAVMSKEDFQTILKNKIRKSKLEQMEVLHQLPFFSVWTKSQLLKLVTFILEPKQFIKNQVVYREGDRSESIYIIRQGEFEVNRRYQKQVDYTYDAEKVNQRLDHLKEGGNNQRNNNGDSNESPNKNKSTAAQPFLQQNQGRVQIAKQLRNVQTFKLALLGPGQLFGDEDVLFDRPYSSTIICRSNSGVVIQMNGPELLKKMKGNDECWRIFQDYILNKEQMIGSRLHKIDFVYHKEPVQQEKQLFENVQRKYPSLGQSKAIQTKASQIEAQTPIKVLSTQQAQSRQDNSRLISNNLTQNYNSSSKFPSQTTLNKCFGSMLNANQFNTDPSTLIAKYKSQDQLFQAAQNVPLPAVQSQYTRGNNEEEVIQPIKIEVTDQNLGEQQQSQSQNFKIDQAVKKFSGLLHQGTESQKVINSDPLNYFNELKVPSLLQPRITPSNGLHGFLRQRLQAQQQQQSRQNISQNFMLQGRLQNQTSTQITNTLQHETRNCFKLGDSFLMQSQENTLNKFKTVAYTLKPRTSQNNQSKFTIKTNISQPSNYFSHYGTLMKSGSSAQFHQAIPLKSNWNEAARAHQNNSSSQILQKKPFAQNFSISLIQ